MRTYYIEEKQMEMTYLNLRLLLFVDCDLKYKKITAAETITMAQIKNIFIILFSFFYINIIQKFFYFVKNLTFQNFSSIIGI